MKKNYYLILSVAFMLFTFQSCKKSSTTPAVTSTNNISFNFNGTAYSSPSTVSASYSQSQGTMQIVGLYTKPITIYISLTGGVKAGTTYNFGDNGGIIFNPDSNSQHSYIFDTGSIVVTTFTGTTITGTFTASGTDLANDAGTMTQGKFQVTYTTVN